MKRARPEDVEAIRAMTLFEDKDLMVLNKPFGLATQGRRRAMLPARLRLPIRSRSMRSSTRQMSITGPRRR